MKRSPAWQLPTLTLIVCVFLMLAGAPQASSGTAVPEPCLAQTLRTLITETREPLLSPTEKEKIDQIFSDRKLAPQEKAKRAFDQIFEARLSRLSPVEQEEVRRVLSEKNVFQGTDGEVYGGFGHLNMQVTVRLPEALEESIVHYGIMTHEPEHAIQELAIRHRLNEGTAAHLIRYSDPYKTQFLTEAGAMQMEWQYFSSIPLQAKQKMLKEIERSPISESDKEFISDMINARASSAAKYVREQHRMGRYSIERVREDRIDGNPLVASIKDGLKKSIRKNRNKLIFFTSVTSALAICGALPTDALVYQYFCSPLRHARPAQ